MLKILALLCLSTAALCQDGMQPDVTFGDDNDRYDIGPMVRDSRAYFNDEPVHSFRSRIESNIMGDEDPDTLQSIIPERRQDFAYRDKMDPDQDEGRNDYEANLKAFAKEKKTRRFLQSIVDKLHGRKLFRRSGAEEPVDPAKEILMHYAVPINLKFHGYLTAPLVE